MTTIGARLRQAREERKLTLADISRETKIQPWVLESLEADRLQELMSPIYVKGFLATYAKFLRLTPEPLVAQLPLSPPEPQPQQAPLPAAVRSPQIPVALRLPKIPLPVLRRLGAVVAVSAVVAVLVVVNPLRTLQKVSLPKLSLPKVSLPKLAMPKLKMPKLAKRSAPTAPATMKTITPKLASVTPIKEPLKPTPPPPLNLVPTQSLELTVSAQRTTWIQVRADGKLLTQQRIQRGANERWVAKKNFEVVVAYPSQVEMAINGQSISPLAIAHRGRLKITHRGVSELPGQP